MYKCNSLVVWISVEKKLYKSYETHVSLLLENQELSLGMLKLLFSLSIEIEKKNPRTLIFRGTNCIYTEMYWIVWAHQGVRDTQT